VVEKLGDHGLCRVGFGVVVKLLKHLNFFEASAGEGDLDGNVLSAMLVPCHPDGRPAAKAEFMDDQISVGQDIANGDRVKAAGAIRVDAFGVFEEMIPWLRKVCRV
jgi:hypothetical protein